MTTNWGWFYTESSDGGENFSAAVAMTPTGTNRPYMKADRVGTNKIYLIMNDGHPAAVSTNSVYFFMYQGGAFKKIDGTALGAFPLTPGPSTMDRVYDGSLSTGRSWVWDVSSDPANDRPIAAFAVFPSTSDHRYYQSRWNGSAWVNNEVCNGGDSPNYLYAAEPYYSGGIALDPVYPNQVFVSRKVGSVFQIFRYVSSDNGATWTGTQLTFGNEHCFRPYVVRGARVLAYCRGRYTSFSDFNTRIQLMQI